MAWGVFLLVGALFTLLPFLIGLATGRKLFAMGLVFAWAIFATASQAGDDELPTFAPFIALLGLVGVFFTWIGADLRERRRS